MEGSQKEKYIKFLSQFSIAMVVKRSAVDDLWNHKVHSDSLSAPVFTEESLSSSTHIETVIITANKLRHISTCMCVHFVENFNKILKEYQVAYSQ